VKSYASSPAAVPGIPMILAMPAILDRDGRDKPGHDEITVVTLLLAVTS
jgi:hypothetical protein